MEQIKIDDFVHFHFLSGLEFSPNGQYACFVVHKANLDDNDYDSNLWLYETSTGRYFQLTALNKERAYTWLNDSEHIVFTGMRDLKDRERKEKGEDLTTFYRINIHGGEAIKYFQVPLTVSQFKPIDEHRFLLAAIYNPNRPPLANLNDQEKAQALKQRKEEQDYEVLEEIPFWSNGHGFISGNRVRVYLYDLSNNTWEPLTPEQIDVSYIGLNEARTQAILIGQEFSGKRQLENNLYILDLQTKALRLVSSIAGFRYYYAEFINEGQLLCLGNAGKRYGLNENPRFYLVDITSGTQTEITPGLDLSIGNSVGSDCRFGGSRSLQKAGDYLYFVATEGADANLYRINALGEITKLTTAPGSVDAYSVHKDNILLIRLKSHQLQELYRLEGDQEVQITHFNDWFSKERSIVIPEPVSYKINDQLQVDGWVLKPLDWDPSKKYPAILDIHGGPKTVYGTVYYHEMQFWANQGYFVMFCNPRGSDGKGNEFADIRGKYGTIDYEDIMGFVDTVLELYPSIDRERLGVTGGSYGGFMTNWIIGHTDRFKAAASQRSISNWISMGFTTDIGYYFAENEIGATPWTDVDKLWYHSPLKYADKVKTPTLFIHSEQDYRCWLVEGIQMFTALKYHGVESRLCMFRGENHELSRSGKPKHRIRRLKEITDWFERYLKQ